MTVTSNKHKINARLGKINKYRPGLEALREAIIKADALGETISSSKFITKYKMGTGTIQALLRIKAIEDKEPTGVYASGKFRWIYQGNPTGYVDQALIEKVIDKENEIKRAHDHHTRSKVEEVTENMKKLPTGKHEDMNKVTEWLSEELLKNDVVSDYLRPQQKVMYMRLVEIMQSLKELKEVVTKLAL